MNWAIAVRRLLGHRSGKFIIAALVILGGLIGVQDPPSGLHRWREADTAMVSWNMTKPEGSFWRPQVDARGTGTGVTKQEFPLYNQLIAWGWELFGWYHAVPRLLTVGFSLLGILALGTLVSRLGGGTRAANLVMLALASAPLWFFYGRKIIPDVPATALALGGFALLVQALQQRRWPLYLAAGVTLCVGGLIKPLALCVGLPILIIIISRDTWRGLFAARVIFAGMITLVPLLIWVAYARHITDPQVELYFTYGVNWGTAFNAIIHGRALNRLFIEWPWQLWVAIPLLPGIAVALWWCHSHLLVKVAGWWFVASYLALLPFSYQFGPHDYYTIVAVPPMALLVGVGLARMAAGPGWARGALVGLIVALPIATWLRVDQRYGSAPDHGQARVIAQHLIPPGDLVIACESTPSVLFYAIDRYGWWTEQPERALELARTTSARWLMVESTLPQADRLGLALGLDQPMEWWGDYWLVRIPDERPLTGTLGDQAEPPDGVWQPKSRYIH